MLEALFLNQQSRFILEASSFLMTKSNLPQFMFFEP